MPAVPKPRWPAWKTLFPTTPTNQLGGPVPAGVGVGFWLNGQPRGDVGRPLLPACSRVWLSPQTNQAARAAVCRTVRPMNVTTTTADHSPSAAFEGPRGWVEGALRFHGVSLAFVALPPVRGLTTLPAAPMYRWLHWCAAGRAPADALIDPLGQMVGCAREGRKYIQKAILRSAGMGCVP